MKHDRYVITRIEESLLMSKKINIRVSDDGCMFQFFKLKIWIVLMKYSDFSEITGEDGMQRPHPMKCMI